MLSILDEDRYGVNVVPWRTICISDVDIGVENRRLTI